MLTLIETPPQRRPDIRECAEPQDLLLRALKTHWQDLVAAGSGRLPALDAIRLAAMPQLLPHLLLVDVEPPAPETVPVYRIGRLGSAQRVMYGGDFAGCTLEEVLGDDRAWMMRHAFDEVRRRRGPVGYAGRVAWWPGKSWITFESIQMPLAGDGTRIDMILGAAVFIHGGRKRG
ncbi:hypothetical protein [Ferrovibrio sp.]|uniref:hypothetical protein n=1 Tax=Ferrovibrio sp. TaxID=1917215 RepID=UPI00311ED67F